MTALIIYNLFSGRSNMFFKLEYIIERLKVQYSKVDSYETKYKNDIKNQMILRGSMYDTIIIAGGDGSLNEAVNGLMLVKNKPKIGYIPMGTCNDFGHSLGLNKTLDKVIDIILNGEYVDVNVNKVNTDYFIYGLAVGNFTDVSYRTKQENKRRIGVLAYFIYAIKSAFTDRTFNCVLNLNNDLKVKKCYCLIMVNSRYLASFNLKFRKKILNNGLNMILIEKKNRLINFIDLFMFFLLGERYKHNIEYYNVKSLEIYSKEPLKYNIDGEELPLLNKVDVEVIEDCIQIIVDPRIKNKYFNK